MAVETFNYYKECVCNFKKIERNCVRVLLSAEELTFLENLSAYCAGVSNDEVRQLNDKEGISRRYYTGFMGEYAVYKYLGIPHKFKGSVAGGSYSNNFPDLYRVGYNLGIKSAKYGHTIKCSKDSHEVQLVCICKEEHYISNGVQCSGAVVYLCGFLNYALIDTYAQWKYIEKKQLRLKGTKVGFLNFEELIPFSRETLNSFKVKDCLACDLNDYIKEYNRTKKMPENVPQPNFASVNGVRKIVYLEKLFGFNLGMATFDDKGRKLYRTYNSDFCHETEDDMVDFFSQLSNADLVMGYGITGYLFTAADKYCGNNNFKFTYIDLFDVWEDENLIEARKVNNEWINKLYVWRDVLASKLGVSRLGNEDTFNYNQRVCLNYLKLKFFDKLGIKVHLPL